MIGGKLMHQQLPVPAPHPNGSLHWEQFFAVIIYKAYQKPNFDIDSL